MIWQDIILCSGNIIFALLLIPMLIDARKGIKINIYTSTLTCAVLIIFNLTYLSLGLWFAALPFTAIIWGSIAYYGVKNNGGNECPHQ
jgi:hypothetical protein